MGTQLLESLPICKKATTGSSPPFIHEFLWFLFFSEIVRTRYQNFSKNEVFDWEKMAMQIPFYALISERFQKSPEGNPIKLQPTFHEGIALIRKP